MAESIAKETGGEVSVEELDLASLESVRQCSNKLKTRLSRIDILINNAGVFSSRKETKEGVELNFGVNHLGHFLLTSRLLPLLLEGGKPARIILVASHGYRYRTLFGPNRPPWSRLVHYENWGGARWPNMLYTYIYSKVTEI